VGLNPLDPPTKNQRTCLGTQLTSETKEIKERDLSDSILSKTQIAELMITHFGDKNNITNCREFSSLLRQMADARMTLSLFSNDLKESCFNGIEHCSPLMDQNEIRNLVSA
jgi:hypothetical protein